MPLMNESQIFYTIVDSATTNITGHPFLTLLLVFLLVMSLAIAFKIPMEYTALFILPLGLVLMAYVGEFAAIGFFLLLYLGFLMSKNFFFSR